MPVDIITLLFLCLHAYNYSGELKQFNAALVYRWRPANSEVPERNLNPE